MDVRRIEDMTAGWFIGNFNPSAYNTTDFEVGYKLHKQGESWPIHYHKIATEITYLLRGRMTIGGRELTTGDIFTIFPYEVADPVFLEDCEVIIIKVPSVPGDKYEL